MFHINFLFDIATRDFFRSINFFFILSKDITSSIVVARCKRLSTKVPELRDDLYIGSPSFR